LFADDQLGPSVGGSDIDRGELPDRALGLAEPPDVETVDPDQLAWPLNVNVLLSPGSRGGS
jgi:hypothetical protein